MKLRIFLKLDESEVDQTKVEVGEVGDTPIELDNTFDMEYQGKNYKYLTIAIEALKIYRDSINGVNNNK